jgi:predicted DNA-binding transcriptional regulator
MKLTQLTKEEKLLYVGLLTELQKDEIVGQLFAPDSYYNPIQDIDDNWIISVEEMEQTITPEFMWVKELPLIPYNPKQYENLFL